MSRTRLEGWRLVGIGEAAQDVGVSLATLQQRRLRHDDFPTPLAVVNSRSIYDVLEIREYMETHPQLPTRRFIRRRAEAPGRVPAPAK